MLQTPLLSPGQVHSRLASPLHASTSSRSSSSWSCSSSCRGFIPVWRKQLSGTHTFCQSHTTCATTHTPASTSQHVPAASIFRQAKPAAKWGTGGSAPAKSQGGKKGSPTPGGDGDDDLEKWGILDWSRFEGWDVPWGAGRTIGGMALWFGSFVAVGFLVVPGLYGAAGGWVVAGLRWRCAVTCSLRIAS